MKVLITIVVYYTNFFIRLKNSSHKTFIEELWTTQKNMFNSSKNLTKSQFGLLHKPLLI